MMSEKIRRHHLERKAILYVRQSSAHQVLHNRESSALQYAMRDRLIALGWSEIETVDDDLGRSAAGGVARAGFERMVADVCLGKVGAVAAREVSRFARNSRDWQQLIEMCRVVDTVLIDQETVYAPRQGNDRLLLGLKGSLNEYELDLLRQRSLSARYEKARRGELVVAAPVGFVKVDDRLEKDPDRRPKRKRANGAIRSAKRSHEISKRRAMRRIAPSASTTPPILPTVWSPRNWRCAGTRRSPASPKSRRKSPAMTRPCRLEPKPPLTFTTWPMISGPSGRPRRPMRGSRSASSAP